MTQGLLSGAIKRGLDIAGAVAVLTATTPLLAGTALVIRTTMGSPVVFRQRRPGLKGEPFELLKFRTMRERREGEQGADADGERLTHLGRILRDSSLDELPTMWNVLKGDMSLVGPRPLLMRYMDRYTPQQARRHGVKPGITGWAQVNGRNELSWEEKFELDTWYVDKQSMMLDIKILAMTVIKVVRREGISKTGHATMPEFLGRSARLDGDREQD